MDKTKDRPKAYDRVKNANNSGDVFIKTEYWTNEVEDGYEAWRASNGADPLEDLINGLLEEEVAVSFKRLEGSTCCTLAHQPSRAANLPYLLTGWSDNANDALTVCLFKLQVMLKGVWEAPPVRPAPRRR